MKELTDHIDDYCRQEYGHSNWGYIDTYDPEELEDSSKYTIEDNIVFWNDCVEIENEQVVKIGVSWSVEDVRHKLNVSHMTDREIFDELENMTKKLQEVVLSCSSDLIDSNFKIKEK